MSILAAQHQATLQPKRSSLLTPAPAARPHGGRSLDAATLATMQARFGQDFSGVRIHTDETAAQSADARDTRAFSQGADLVFGRGQYSPATPDGQRLIAHELAHVAQQQQGDGISGNGGSPETRAETAAQQVMHGHRVDTAALGGVAPGIHCDGNGKDEKKKVAANPAAAPAPKPFFMPMTMLPLPQLQMPSLLQPPARQPIIPIPQFNTSLPPSPFDPGTGLGMHPPALTPSLPTTLPGSTAGGPLAPTAQPFTMPPLPSSKSGAGTGPDLPSRIGLFDAGRFSIGLRLDLPAPPKAIEGTPAERRPHPPFQIPGSGPSALSVSEYQGELLDMSITGKIPAGFDAIDKGELAKILFGIASTYIAPDFFKSLASKVAGKPGADYQIDFSLTGDFKGGGIVFTMPLGKPPKAVPRSDTP
jgi:hypothetical protein